MNNDLIPKHWTTDQALAVYDFLGILTEQIWQRYETPFLERFMHEDVQPPIPCANTTDEDELDDEIPF